MHWIWIFKHITLEFFLKEFIRSTILFHLPEFPEISFDSYMEQNIYKKKIESLELSI